MTFEVHDISITPTNYVGNGRGEYLYHLVFDGDVKGGFDALADVGIIWDPGPGYAAVNVGNRDWGSWKNNTGAAMALEFHTWAERTFAGLNTSYTVSVKVTEDGEGDPPSCDPEEWVRATLGDQPDGGVAGDPVNTASGNFFDTVVDVPNVGALGDPLLARTYNALDPGRVVNPDTGQRGMFGDGWTSWLDSSLTQPSTDQLLYRDPTGRQVLIPRGTAGAWMVPTDLQATIVDGGGTGGGRQLKFVGGRTVTFDAAGRIIAASAGGGDTVAVDRDPVTKTPTKAVFNSGSTARAQLTFTDVTKDGLIDRVEGPGGVQVAYSYDAQSRLAGVSVPFRAGDESPLAESYEWTGGRVTRILTHLGGGLEPKTRVKNTYDFGGRVASQIQEDGDKTTFAYKALDANGNRRTTVTHTGGGSSDRYVYTHNAAGAVVSVADATGASIGVSWQNKKLSTSTTQTGSQTSYGYDAKQRMTSSTLPAADPGSAPTAAAVESVTYCDVDADDQRVRSITGANGAVTQYAYGASGAAGYPCAGQGTMPTSVTEGVGSAAAATTRYEWADGLPVKVTDPDGVVTRMRWDAARRLLLAKETDADTTAVGAEVTYNSYDAAGRLRVTRSPAGVETWYDTDAAGRVVKITGPFRAPTRGCVALADNCAFPTTTPSDPAVQQFTYRRDGKMTARTDQTGRVWTYSESPRAEGGRDETETRPDGSVKVTSFDTAGRLLKEQVGSEGEQSATYYQYGIAGRLASIGDGYRALKTFNYDADGNLAQELDPYQRGTTTTYDRRGRVTARRDALGNTSTYAYDAAGNLTRYVDRMGAATTYTYDPMGRQLTVTDARGGVTTTAYTAAGRLSKVTDATGRATSYAYDSSGRLTATTRPSGAKVRLADDADANVVRETSPAGRVTTYAYDAAGRQTQVTTPSAGTTTMVYNPRGDLLTRSNAVAGTTSWTYDAVGRVKTVTDPLNATTTFGYDSRGNRTTRTDAYGNVTSWGYDERDRLTEVTNPLGQRTVYGYDAYHPTEPWVKAVGGFGGIRTEYKYNANGQMIWAGDRYSTRVQVTYDAEGRRTKLVDSTGTTQWTYDSVGNLVAVDNPKGGRLTWAWDLAGRRTTMTYPDGTQRRNTYTPDGYIASVQRLSGTTWNTVATNTWDADGLLTQQQQTGQRTRTWTLNAATGLTSRYQDIPSTTGAGTARDTALTYDTSGRLTKESTTVPGTSTAAAVTLYTYDKASQVLEVDRNVGADETYTYDKLGRRTSLATVNGTTRGSTTYEYDAASQLTKRTVDGIAHAYTYDAGLRTGESWTVPSGTAAGDYSVAWTWGYYSRALEGETYTSPQGVLDIKRQVRSDGQLVHAVYNSTSVTGTNPTTTTATTKTVDVGWDETGPLDLAAWTRQKTTTAKTVSGRTTTTSTAATGTAAVYGGTDLVRTDCSTLNATTGAAGAVVAGCSGSVAHDYRGSALTAPDTTSAVRAASYGAFGEPAASASPPNPPTATNPGSFAMGFGYLGELHAGSLVNLRARDYDTATGTFLSPDPLDGVPGVDGTTTIANPFHYADNNPLNTSDPSGQRPGGADCGSALVPIICRYQHPIIVFTASIGAGFACGVAAAPAGPFAAGAASATCGGMVHRGLSAHYDGENPWTAALDPQAVITDAILGGYFGLLSGIIRPGSMQAVEAGASALPRLTGTIAESFEGGTYTTRTFKAGTEFYRAEGWGASAPGHFLGMEAVSTRAEAEAAYNIAIWGNPSEVMRTYRLTKDITMYYGRVAGGDGYQALIPRSEDPSAILRQTGARDLR